jgi:CRISPR-associated protein Cas2
MSNTQPKQWLVTYDITDPRRLSRVFKTLKKEGTPIQYSVFYVEKNVLQMGALMVRLAGLIKSSDDVRAYPIPCNPKAVTMGRSILPEEVLLDSSNPFDPHNAKHRG